MGSFEPCTVETTINELITALREKPGGTEGSDRETQILVAYMLSGLFGTDGLCSRTWQ